MTHEFEIDLDETPIFTSAGFSCGLLDLRVIVDAVNEEQWWISDIGLRGYKPKESGGFDWSYRYLQLDDPLWLILHAAIMQTQLEQLKVAIHDKLYDLRGERARELSHV